jgi:drug/metabolite transporter (DMT)-like permease
LKRKRVVSSFKEMDKSTLRWLIIRGVVGATVMLVSFIGLAMPDTSLSEFGALSNINPVFAVIFAWIFLKEDLNWKVWLSLLIAIIGVFTVNSFSLSFSTGNILIILSAIGEGFVMVCIRKLKVNGVDSWLVVVPLLVFGLIITFPRVIFTLTPYSIKTICYLIAVGGASTLGQLLLTSAAKYVKARTISILGLLSVFELTLVDIVKGLGVTFPKIFGGLLIVLSSVIIIMISVGKNKSS